MRRRFFVAVLLAPLCFAVHAGAGSPPVSSSDDDVTTYAASWCSACASLHHDLRERKIPFVEIDVEANPRAFERARTATGQSVIPQTSIATRNGLEWVVGADADAVERAYRNR